MPLRHRFLLVCAFASPVACSSSSSNPGGPVDAGSDASPPAQPDSAPPDAGSDACPPPAPPPSGFSLLRAGDASSDVGMHTALALDGDGSPLLAYERVVTQDGGAPTSEVWFTRWDRTCGGRWVAPVKVDSMSHLTDGTRGVDVAYDASTGAVGIAYRAHTPIPSPQDNLYELRVATLAKGAGAFTIETPFGFHSSDVNAPAGPNSAAIAMANGTTWVAATAGYVGTNCTSNCDGVMWSKRSGATWDPFTRVVIPNVQYYGVSLQVDSAGKPAFAYGYADSSKSALAYRRLDGNGVDAITGTPSPAEAELAFDGTKPRIVGLMHQSDWATTNKELWFSASDDGATWSAAVSVPPDQEQWMNGYPMIAVGPSGKVAVGGTTGGGAAASFATPKFSVTGDAKSFTTMGPALIPSANADYTQWMRAAYGEGGKLEIAFYLASANSSYVTGKGLVFWRE